MRARRELPLRRRIKQAGVPFVTTVSALLFRAWKRTVLASSHVEGEGLKRLVERQARGEDTIVALLHQDVIAAAQLLDQIRDGWTIVAHGDAGDITVRILETVGIDSMRGGSSTRASRRAPILREAVRRARAERGRGFAAFMTPDGSRGPAGACKPGVALFAIQTRTPVCCMRVHVRPALYAPTWDRSLLPLPFSRIRVELTDPIEPPERASRQSLEAMRARIEATLHRLHKESFSREGRRPIPPLELFAGAQTRTSTPRSAR